MKRRFYIELTHKHNFVTPVEAKELRRFLVKTEVELVQFLLDDLVYGRFLFRGGITVFEIPDLRSSEELINRKDLVLGARKVGTFPDAILEENIFKKMSPVNWDIVRTNYKIFGTVEIVLGMEKFDTSKYFFKIVDKYLRLKLLAIVVSRGLEKRAKEEQLVSV